MLLGLLKSQINTAFSSLGRSFWVVCLDREVQHNQSRGLPGRQPLGAPLCITQMLPSLEICSSAHSGSLPALEATPPAPGSLACGRWDRSPHTAKKQSHQHHQQNSSPHKTTPRGASTQPAYTLQHHSPSGLRTCAARGI